MAETVIMASPYATKVVSGANTIQLTNAKLYAGRAYYVKVAFRTRGDGNSTASKCSSVGFIAHWDNWAQGRSYIHNSAQAYAERGAFVTWTYSFTVPQDVQPQGTNLYFIVNNAWANGFDNQTIYLYHAKYWDSAGNVYDEMGGGSGMLNVRQGGATRQPAVFSTTKYTTPSLCCRKSGATYYVPLVTRDGQVSLPDGFRYGYSEKSYPRMAFRYGGATYYAVNKQVPRFTYSFLNSTTGGYPYGTTYMKTLVKVSLSAPLSIAVGIYFSSNGGSSYTKAGVLSAGSVAVTVNSALSASSASNYKWKVLIKTESAGHEVVSAALPWGTTSLSQDVPKGYW